MTEPAIQKLSMAVQITKLKTRFGLTRVALVGDRGMLASARIRDELRPAALDWISALRAPTSRPSLRPMRCSCRCSMSRTWSRSPTRTTPASGWCAAGLAPILFYDHGKPAARAKRAHPVAAAQRSNPALAKASRKHTEDDCPVHSFTSLLADLATICANHIQPAHDMPAFTMITTPTPLQRRAFELLGISHRHGPA
jgi:hypothetical protein